MLRSHSAICLRQGLTEGQLRQMTKIVNGLKEDADPPFCTRHADARQSELRGGGGAWLQGYAGAQDGFDCTGWQA